MNKNFRSVRPVYPALVAAAVLLIILIAPGLFSPVVAAFGGPQATQSQSEPTPEQTAFFEQHIQPILANHCLDCHSTDTRSAGQLRLDDRDAVLQGGKSGPAVIPGNPDESLLIKRILEDNAKTRMPKGESEPLSEKEIADLKTWIAQGAPWPAIKLAAQDASSSAPAKSASNRIAKPIPYPAGHSRTACLL